MHSLVAREEVWGGIILNSYNGDRNKNLYSLF